VQAVSQQIPPTHWPEVHSALAEHEPPLPVLPQLFMVQTLGGRQLVLLAQESKQAVPLVLHTKGLQARVPPATQRPTPSQVEAARCVPAVHEAATQMVPSAYLRQAPAPSQTPSVPQAEGPWSVQMLLGSLAPGATATHCPAVPASLHEKQLALQALSQHTPSAQKPERHSAGLVTEQACPFGFLPHELFTQVLGATQSALLAQVLAQAPPLHLKGAHEDAAGGVQRPLTQVLAWVKRFVAASHEAGLQVVPAA
jgi:hypothetical protein